MSDETAADLPRFASGGPASHLVVGFGSSAGGMQAMTQFFERMPVPNGMAFVVVMHLSPNYPSHATEILQRTTAMKVCEITEHMPIEPDRVYVIPPAHVLSMNDGHLMLRDDRRPFGRSITIDLFFRGLAEAHRHHAVAVVLSGTGTDGSVGLTRLKELGGVTLAQEPEEAQHPGMPESAIATGLVDLVLPVAEMPARLQKLAALLGQMRLPADVAPAMNAIASDSQEEARRTEAALAEVMTLLRSRTRHDFRHYKRPTVLRRLERRMQVTGMPDLPAYRDHLVSNEEETHALLQDMLISVTNFFRDREAFEALERDVLPRLQSQLDPEQGLRVWVIGCASGEEAYSVAMLLQELRESDPRAAPFQVFASDIDENALATARAGLYPGSIVTDVQPMRIRKYFTREDNHFRIAKSLRERVLFADHNVLRDPPFSRVDLICCRNLLIYLDRAAQSTAMDVMRFALRPAGTLFLGSSESAEVGGDAFEIVDKRHRIYRLAGSADAGPEDRASPARAPLPISMPQLEQRPPARAGLQAARKSVVRQVAEAEMHQRAVLAWAPPSVLVDGKHKILHLSDGMSPFLQVQSGAPSHNLLDNVVPALRLELRSALFRARPVGTEEVRPVRFEVVAESTRVRVTVQVVGEPKNAGGATLVVFEKIEAAEPAPAANGADTTSSDAETWRVQRELDGENKRLELHLQEVIERSESSTEELMSSNEELQAVNEELRSATEELETSREELQSTNEELSTVNAQLAMKVEETSRINDDLHNLINATDIATVFVDRTMRIKRFTPRAVELFNLLPGDVGRSLTDITHRLDYPQLMADAGTAFDSLRLVEREVSGADDRHFVARMVPYRTTEDKIEGAVLGFVEVTALRHSQRALLASTERLHLAAATTRDFAILTADNDGSVSSWNKGAERLFGYTESEMIGRSFALIFTEADREAGAPERELARALQHGRADDERWHRRKDGSVFYCSGVTSRLEGELGISKIARDLTGSQQASVARESLLSSETRSRRRAEATMESKELFLAVMSHELKHPLGLISLNAEFLARLPEIRSVPSAARAARLIQQTVSGQARIIDDLLDLSRVRTGKLRLEPAGGRLGRVDAAHRRQPGARSAGARGAPVAGVGGAAAGHDVRSGAGRTGGVEPAEQCAEVHAAGRLGARHAKRRRRRGLPVGRRHRARHCGRSSSTASSTCSARKNCRCAIATGLAVPAAKAAVRRAASASAWRWCASWCWRTTAGSAHAAKVWGAAPSSRSGCRCTTARWPRTTTSLRLRCWPDLRLLVVDDSPDSVESFGLLLGLTGARVTTATDGAWRARTCWRKTASTC